MHEVLVNRLGGLSLPRKSVVRLTDRPDMTLDVYRGRKTTIQHTTIISQTGAEKTQTSNVHTGKIKSACKTTQSRLKPVVSFEILFKANKDPAQLVRTEFVFPLLQWA